MAVNVKLGNNTITGVSTVKLESADTPNTYIPFKQSMEGNTVTFISEGNTFAQLTVGSGESINDIKHPTASGGGVFDGWGLTASATTYIEFPYTPSDNVTLYAIFKSYDVVLNNNSWSTISACSTAGIAENIWNVGDTKTITLNGTCGTLSLNNLSVKVYILGFNHNSAVEGTGISFGCFKTNDNNATSIALVDSYYNTNAGYSGTKAFAMNHWGTSSDPYNTNYGGWAASDMRYDILGSTDVQPNPYGSKKTTTALGYDPTATCTSSPVSNSLMSCLPADLRAVMKPITKYTDNKGNSSNVSANVTTTIDYLPLLSEYEVQGTRSYANQYEQNNQARYQYYISGNSKIKYKHTDATSSCLWWVRSPYYYNASNFCSVNTDGSASSNRSSGSVGVAPAFLV